MKVRLSRSILALVLHFRSNNKQCLVSQPLNANEQHAASTAIQSLRPACEVLPDASALFLCSSPFKPVKLCESSGKNRDQYKSKQSAGSFPKQSTQLHKGKLRLFSAIFFASSDAEVPLAFPKACDQTIQRVLCQFG